MISDSKKCHRLRGTSLNCAHRIMWLGDVWETSIHHLTMVRTVSTCPLVFNSWTVEYGPVSLKSGFVTGHATDYHVVMGGWAESRGHAKAGHKHVTVGPQASTWNQRVTPWVVH